MITYQATPDFYNDYIKHHGILGMRWGEHNGPPYPLDVSDHSASEKKAGWKKSLGSGKIVKKKTNKIQEYNQKVKKAAENDQDMYNDLLYEMTYGNESNKKAAEKDFNDAIKTMAKENKIGKKDLEKEARRIFDEREKEIKEIKEKERDPKYKYTPGFINYVKKEAGGFDMIDDPEFLELLIMEYEDLGKKAEK